MLVVTWRSCWSIGVALRHRLQHPSRATIAASSDRSTSESSTTNSSPPCRLTVSEARTHSTRRSRDRLQQPVADRVPERVVDVLEAVEVQEQHRDLVLVARGQRDRLADPVVEKHPVRQAGQEVVLGRVRHLLRHRPRRAHVAEHDDRAGRPSLRGRGSGRRSPRSGSRCRPACTRTQFGGSLHVRVAPDRLSVGSRGSGARLVASRIRNTSPIGLPLGLRQRPAGHGFGGEVEERDRARDVGADHGVADAVERDLGALLLDEQRLLHGLALDRVAERPQQAARLDLALDEVVLRAFLQGLRRQRARRRRPVKHDQGTRGAAACARRTASRPCARADRGRAGSCRRRAPRVLLGVGHALDVGQLVSFARRAR